VNCPARLGKNVALLRDMTDTMYNPAKVRKMPSWPRSWANFSLLSPYSHENAWANLRRFGQAMKLTPCALKAPFVTHFEGNRLVFEYIERTVCPTATSDCILGGAPFAFADVTRPPPPPMAPRGSLEPAEPIRYPRITLLLEQKRERC
jgi:hypothetical protein